MLAWSTDSLRPHERFAYWREERGKLLFGVTIELPPEKRMDFHGRFSARVIGGATLAAMTASAYDVARTEADIDRLPNDSLNIGLQAAGPGWCDTPAGQSFIEAGGVSVGHGNLPMLGRPTTDGDFHVHILSIPLAGREEARHLSRELFMAPVVSGRSRDLLMTTLEAFIEEAPGLAPEAAGRAVGDLTTLALLARGLLPPGAVETRHALRSAYLHAARRIMRHNFRRTDLTAETVAARIGISVRQLHLVFEPTGMSFQRTLTAMRVEAACRRLLVWPYRPVAEIAFACGFDSLATFYRAFQNVGHGTPTDYRRAARLNP